MWGTEGADTAAGIVSFLQMLAAAVSAPSSLLNKLKSHSDRKGGISNNPLSNLSDARNRHNAQL